LERVVKSGARFDPDKAKWFNENWLRMMDDQKLLEMLKPLASDKGLEVTDSKLLEVVKLLKERVSFIHEFLEAEYLFEMPKSYDQKTVKKKWKDQSANLMKQLMHEFSKLGDDFSADDAKNAFSQFMETHELGFGQLGPALRLLLTGLGGGPDLFQIMGFLGKDESLQRMRLGISSVATLKETI